MSLLSYNRLCELVAHKVIENVTLDQINSTSIDITLGNKILIEQDWPRSDVVSLKGRDRLDMKPFYFSEENSYFILKPGQFILASSEQVFNLPLNISGEYKLKSSMARIGLEHMNAGWCDAGWNNSVLTLELKNMTEHHNIMLHQGVGIGQMVFFEHEPVPEERSYARRGRYNGDRTVEGIKP